MLSQMQGLAKISKYLILALAAILLAQGWRQNKQHPRPIGVRAVTLYFLAVTLLTLEGNHTILSFYGAINAYTAAEVWFMRSDGRRKAMILSWINIAIVALLGVVIFSSARYAQDRAHWGGGRQLILGMLLLAFMSLPAAILNYLKNPHVASLFSTKGLTSKDLTS